MSRLMRPFAVVLGLLVAASGGTFVWARASSHPAGPVRRAATAPSSTITSSVSPPVVVPQLVPAVTTTVATATTTPPLVVTWSGSLDAALAGTNSCLRVEDGSGRPLYQHRSSSSLVPASTQKLLVAAAALATLGPNFRFTTTVVAPSAPVAGEVPALWLVGNGDPLLATPEFIATQAGRVRVAGYQWTPLAALADAVAAAGVRRVSGGVGGDDHYLDRLRFLPVWPAFYQRDQEIGLLSALSVNEGLGALVPTPVLAMDPPGFAAGELARLLGQRQVATGPSGRDQAAPAQRVVLASVSSAPLSRIVEGMLRASDNWIAELLVRQIDRATGGTGTTAGGLAVVMRQAAALGVPVAGAHMDDGSGLSPTNRATCDELLATLKLGQRAGFSPMSSGLPVAALSGTLWYRYRRTPIAGKLAAKTGSLDNVGGMVGELSVGPTMRFALLINRVQNDAAMMAQEDRVIDILAAYGGMPH